MLSPGSRLGPYEILAPIGAGGMGEVYRARDTRLDRDVAIKVLPPSFAADPDRLARFEQEARAASALNHPNILIVFDIGSADGAPFVVTELLEGETLTGLVNGTPLPLRKAIDYASQIARGLAAAHSRGIVHRDLKPDNVFVTTDGRVKILDFGLAKLMESVGAGLQTGPTGATALPTAAAPPNTMPGVVLGTVGYMSPEQVRGRSTDHRSDIFAFGAILYEMLSGHRAFRGESAIETMSAILKEEPAELSSPGRAQPPALERIVHHCLEKSPEQRFQSASDIAFALESLSGSSDAVASPSVISSAGADRPRQRGGTLIWKAAAAVAALVALVAVPFAVTHWREKPADRRLMRFSIDLPEDTTFGQGGIASIAVSPDGRHVAFTATSSAGNRLWLQPLDDLSARVLPGAEALPVNSWIFWSPDSRSIAFLASNKLKRIDIAGGSPQTIGELPPEVNSVIGGTWNAEGTILVGTSRGLHSVRASGGTFARVTTPTASESVHAFPQFLPDGRRYIFSKGGGSPTGSGLYLASIDSQDIKKLSPEPGYVQFSNGSLLSVRERSLLAQSLDLNRGELQPGGTVIADEVQANPNNGRSAFSVSDNGVLVFYSGREPASQFVWFDRNGRAGEAVGTPGTYSTMALSRDEHRVVYARRDSGFTQNLWITDLVRNVTTKLTFGSNRDSDGTWSPDGSRVAFASIRDGAKSLYEIPSAGGPDRLLLKGDGPQLSMDAWSPDGRVVVYHADSTREMRALQLDDRKDFLISKPASGRADEPFFSDDGKWLAYDSDESGRFEVFVIPFPPTGAKWQVSSNGGGQPRWRRDGRELFYLAPDGSMMAVDIKASTSIETGSPRILFKTNMRPSFTTDQYAVSADGQRFLIMNPVGEARPLPMTVVLDWPALLRK